MAGQQSILTTSRPGVKGQAESPDWAFLFSAYRIQDVHGGQVVTGRLRPGLDPCSDPARSELERWPGSYEVRGGDGAGWDVILHRDLGARSERWWLHAALLALTAFSTIVAGSLLRGADPLVFRAVPLPGAWWFPIPVGLEPAGLVPGIPFGIALLGILGTHEAGHYVAARYHRISVTPPFFIPFPPYLSIIGTLGAFIRLRSPVLNRRALLDVGIAGPIMSFVVSIPILWWGLLHSRIVRVADSVPSDYLVRFLTEEIWLGGSVAVDALARLVVGFTGQHEILVLHPLAFAGWIGLFVTALNLLPISQLDGGHILYAALGRRQTVREPPPRGPRARRFPGVSHGI